MGDLFNLSNKYIDCSKTLSLNLQLNYVSCSLETRPITTETLLANFETSYVMRNNLNSTLVHADFVCFGFSRFTRKGALNMNSFVNINLFHEIKFTYYIMYKSNYISINDQILN